VKTLSIRSIWISPGHDFAGHHGRARDEHGVVSVARAECHAGKGIVGDRYYGHKENFKGQITFFSAEVADAVRRSLGLETIEAALFRRNVFVEGVDLNTLIGRRFRLGDLELSGSEECRPCYWMDQALAPGAHRALEGRGGLRCRILTGGILSVGEAPFEVIE
jgi:MOSC domain-containing protein YiiM